MRVGTREVTSEVRWGKGEGARHTGFGRGPGSFRNSGRGRACLGGVAEGLDPVGVKELPCAKFHAFKTGFRIMGREWKAKFAENRGLFEPSAMRREHASIVSLP